MPASVALKSRPTHKFGFRLQTNSPVLYDSVNECHLKLNNIHEIAFALYKLIGREYCKPAHQNYSKLENVSLAFL